MLESSDSSFRSLPELVKAYVRVGMEDVFTCLPAELQSYDPTTERATVKILVKDVGRRSKKSKSFPILSNVLVKFPSSKNAILSFPLTKGDTGSVHFYDRSIEEWKVSVGQEVAPKDPRIHDLSDAVFYPGVWPFKGNAKIHATDLKLAYNNAELRFQPGDKIALGSSLTRVELLSLFGSVIDALTTAVITPAGPNPQTLDPATIAALQLVRQQLSSITGTF